MKKLLLITLTVIFLYSCQKEVQKDKQQITKSQFPMEKLLEGNPINERGKPRKPVKVCIYMNYNGEGPYLPAATPMSEKPIIANHVYTLLNRYDIVVTDDKIIYNSYKPGERMMIVVTDSPIGFLGFAEVNALVNANETNPVLVWYYGATHNIAEVDYLTQLGRLVVHEFLHTCGLLHQDCSLIQYIMTCYPFYHVSVNMSSSEIAIVDKVIKKRR